MIVIVAPGQTLWGIAGPDYAAVARANGIRNPNLIYVGEKIVVTTRPAPAESASSISPVATSSPSSISSVTGSLTSTQACIISRESSGNPDAVNGDHYGLYQMTPALWQMAGGPGYSALGASIAEQDAVYQNIVNNDINGGLSNWVSYDGC